MDLVNDQRLRPGEQGTCFRPGQKKAKALRSSQQNLGRPALLTLPARGRGVARPDVKADVEFRLGDEACYCSGDIRRERLQWRNIYGMKTSVRRLAQRRQRRQKPRQGLPSAGRCDQQRGTSRLRNIQHGNLMRMRMPTPGGEPRSERSRKRFGHRGTKTPSLTAGCREKQWSRG